MPLYLDLLPEEKIDIDCGRIILTVCRKTGRKVRLAITADKDVAVTRLLAVNDAGGKKTASGAELL